VVGLKLIAYAGNPVLPAIGWKCEPDPFDCKPFITVLKYTDGLTEDD
jgi:hypothetical protein